MQKLHLVWLPSIYSRLLRLFQERDLAKQAINSYNDKLYTEALAHLEALILTRASDPIVINNHAVVKFYAEGGGFNQVSSLACTLNSTFSNITTGALTIHVNVWLKGTFLKSFSSRLWVRWNNRTTGCNVLQLGSLRILAQKVQICREIAEAGESCNTLNHLIGV